MDDRDLLAPGQSYASVTDQITDVVLYRPIGLGWAALFLFSTAFVGILLIAVSWLIAKGVGIWGVNIPVAWGFAITNFVWWIGIGHAGTFISAFLLLMRQHWRTSINRFAEAMTLFAVACAGLFPLLHLGRPWFFYWLIPYPNIMSIWPQFRSPLMWDFFAVSTYFTVSLIFWYVGLIPDLAAMRERAQSKSAKYIFGFFALGWRGSAAHWERYEMTYLLLGGLATPLVISVHSVVSLDFAAAIVPGWHSTIFPPYFVAGAIFSGFAMVLTLAIPLRWYYGMKNLVTISHLDVMAKLMLATGLIVDYGYCMEIFLAGFYTGDQYERYMQVNRAFGNYGSVFWLVIACNVGVTQLLWFKTVRQNAIILFIVSLFINVGMWTERFMIVVQSLHRDFIPAQWRMFYPTFWDLATFFGTIGLFFFLFLLFLRLVPMISISEVRKLVHESSMESALQK